MDVDVSLDFDDPHYSDLHLEAGTRLLADAARPLVDSNMLVDYLSGMM